MKYWEFRRLIDAFYRQKARDSLNLYQMTAAAFGGEKRAVERMLRDLRKQAGYENSTQPQNGKAWGGMFDALPIPSVEDFQQLKAG